MSEHAPVVNSDGVAIFMMFDRCRTGSTTILRSLGSIPNVVTFQEILNGNNSYSYQNFLLRAIGTSAESRDKFLLEGPLFAFSDYVSWLKEEAKSKCPDLTYLVLECKIENMSVFSAQWHNPIVGFFGNEFLNRAIRIADHIIFLRRINTIARICSAHMAQHTGIFHSKDGDQAKVLERSPVEKIRIPPKLLARSAAMEVDFDVAFAEFLKKKEVKATYLQYEEVFNTKEGAFFDDFMESMAGLFGGMAPPAPAMKRVRTISEREMIENFDELLSEMKKSESLLEAVKILNP